MCFVCTARARACACYLCSTHHRLPSLVSFADVMIAPLVHKFDGTTLAGGIHPIGTGENKELIGSSVRLGVRKILNMMRQHDDDATPDNDEFGDFGDNGDGNDEDDGGTSLFEPDSLHREVNSVARQLYRSVDAHHLQSMSVLLCILFANLFHVSLSSVSDLRCGQSVQAQVEASTSTRYRDATVQTVDDDG